MQLGVDRLDELQRFLHAEGWLPATRRIVQLASAGAGNMNTTLRVIFDEGSSLIVKQSLPFVAKYPHILAPDSRILSEVAFYRATSQVASLRSCMPALKFVCAAEHIAGFEDLGAASDMTDLYGGARISDDTAVALLNWLSALHSATFYSASDPASDPASESGTDSTSNSPGTRDLLANRQMRALNYAHIFSIPLTGDGAPELDAITPGLSEVALSLRSDHAYRARVAALGEQYLADDRSLLHGDFYPGSWLRHSRGVKIIDAEFAFFGRPEFDLGVFMAHLLLAGYTQAQVQAWTTHYAAPQDFDDRLANAFAGIEIMRRLLGVAQLPLRADLATKSALLSLSRAFVMGNG